MARAHTNQLFLGADPNAVVLGDKGACTRAEARLNVLHVAGLEGFLGFDVGTEGKVVLPKKIIRR